MMPITSSPTMQTARLDHTLEYAVIQNWDELMPGPTPGLIHVEYQTGPDGSLYFLKVWATTIRGCWNLICEFWMQPLWSHAMGLRLGKDYHCDNFAHTLEFVLRNENSISKLPNKRGLIQVSPPTKEERREALDHQCSPPLEPHAAA